MSAWVVPPSDATSPLRSMTKIAAKFGCHADLHTGLQCCLSQQISSANATTSTDQPMKSSCDGTTPQSASTGLSSARYCPRVMEPHPCWLTSKDCRLTAASNAYPPNRRVGPG